jgi:hypothetical protein
MAVFIVRVREGVTTTRFPLIMFGPSRWTVPMFNSSLMTEVVDKTSRLSRRPS